jgi:hypothetical protein
MKKFTEWVGVIREAEEKQMSELQKSYKDYFGAKLNKFNAKSPADLTEEQKKEFFNEIKKDWEIGTGAKPAGKKDVEEHGVKESVNEASQEEQIKKEVISKLSDFFGCAPGNLSKFNFDGKDNIKELGKALRSTSDAGTEQYYRIAIQMAKRDLGINESEDLNESALEIAGGIILGIVGLKFIGGIAKGLFGTLKLKAMKDPAKLKELASQIASKAMDKNPLKAALWLGAVKEMIDSGDIKDGFGLLKTATKMDSIDVKKIFEAEGFDLTNDVNEAFNNYGWFLRLPKKVIANELRSATKNLTSYYNNASSGADLQQDVLEDIISELETVKNQLKKFSKGEKPTGVYESEEVNESNISMYKSMVQNVLKDLDVEVKQSDLKVGTKKSDSWSFVTLNGHVLCSDTAYDQMVAWAKASIKEDPAKYGLPTSLKESEEFEINEAAATPEELASFIQKEEKHFAAFLKPKKLTATVSGKVVTIKPGSGSFTITVDYGKSTIDTTGKPEWPESTSYVELMEYIKITKFKLNESAIFEAEVKNAKDFEEYAMAILKKQHGDDFDEAKAKKTVSGLTAAAEKDGDWGAAVGKLQNA